METKTIYIDKEYAWSLSKGIDPRVTVVWYEPPTGVLHALCEIVNSVGAWFAKVVGDFLEIRHTGSDYTVDAFALRDVILGNPKKAA